jgi:16S rRNA (guanine527-N7)-methyltransferase
MADTLARVAGCLMLDGMVVFMKGPHCDEEVGKATKKFASDYELVDDIPYQIPDTPHRRRLVLFRHKVDPVQTSAASGGPDKYRVKVIESESNAIFKNLRKLLGGRGVKKQGRTLVCGPRLVAEVAKRFPERCLAWITPGDHHPPPTNAPGDQQWIQLAPDLFQTLDVFGTKSPIVLFDCPPPDPWEPETGLPAGCSLMVPFQDPENVGAVIRSAVAFDVDRVILLAQSANPFHPKAVRASAGAVFSARLFQGPSLSEIPQDLPVIALAASGQPLAQTRFPSSFCLLTGQEGPGLPPHWQANAMAIPMNPEVESLNAAVATAIALYEWQRSLN